MFSVAYCRNGPGLPDPASDPSSVSSIAKDFTKESVKEAEDLSAHVSSQESKPVMDPLASLTDDKRTEPHEFAAICYRWSYFQKNLPNLPKKGIVSRKEREKAGEYSEAEAAQLPLLAMQGCAAGLHSTGHVRTQRSQCYLESASHHRPTGQ